MHRHRLLLGVTVLWVAAGCAAVPPAQVGQTAGTIAGMAIAPGVGAPIGAFIGAVAGMLVQGQVDKVTEKRERTELGAQLKRGEPAAADEEPAVPTGSPVRVWVDETVHDGRLVSGHFDVRHLP